jgi:lysophospholipase L1-like esterase
MRRLGAAQALTAFALLSVLAGCQGSQRVAPSSPTPRGEAGAALRLVAIGDSIPLNKDDDCPGCTGFVARYAAAVEKATDRRVEVSNHAQHNGLTLPGLLAELGDLKDDLAGADVIIVGIAHNTIELNADRPCGADLVNRQPAWPAMTASCAERSAQAARSAYEQLFSAIAELRSGKPTLLRTISRYNDWVGGAEAHLTPAQERITAMFIARWNAVLCAAANAKGFGCADIATAFNGSDGLKPSGELLAADYTHPSDRGNARIADVLVAMGFDPLAR